MNSAQKTRIAVLGGGPGGLTLARVLQQHGVSCTSTNGRARWSPGHRAARWTCKPRPVKSRCAPPDCSKSSSPSPDQKARMAACSTSPGKFRLEHQADPDDLKQPEIDRGHLRTLLLDSLGPGTVRWHSDVRDITEDSDSYRIHLADGATHPADVVIGADGAWSKVRPLLSSAKPEYTGVTFVEIHLDEVDEQHPDLAELVGNGSMHALSDNKALIAQRNSGGHIRVYVALRVPEDWAHTCGIDFADPTTARPALRAYFADWAPELLALIDAGEKEFVPRPLYALPFPHTWFRPAWRDVTGRRGPPDVTVLRARRQPRHARRRRTRRRTRRSDHRGHVDRRRDRPVRIGDAAARSRSRRRSGTGHRHRHSGRRAPRCAQVPRAGSMN